MILDFIRSIVGVVIFIGLVVGLNLVNESVKIDFLGFFTTFINLNILGLSIAVLAKTISGFLKNRLFPVSLIHVFFKAYSTVYFIRFSLILAALIGNRIGVDYLAQVVAAVDIICPIVFISIIFKGISKTITKPTGFFLKLPKRILSRGGGKK